MKIIKEIVEDIREELEGAENYAMLATKYREDDRTLADAYAKMSEAELGHVEILHNQAVRLIKQQKAENNSIPAGMQAVWDWEHEIMMHRSTKIKMMLDAYRK